MGEHGRVPTSIPLTQPAETGVEIKVVVGVDGSACAERALVLGAYEAAIRGALLHVISAYEVAPTAGWSIPLTPFEDSAAAIIDQSVATVHDHYPELVVKGEYLHGYAGKILVEAARDAQLLVVGSCGHSGWTDLLIGSVSEYCVHHASVPTLVVH